MATFIDWFCKRRGITELKPQDLEGPAFEIIKVCICNGEELPQMCVWLLLTSEHGQDRYKESTPHGGESAPMASLSDMSVKSSFKLAKSSELRILIEKIKGKAVDTNFEKPLILGKPPLQPIKNQPVSPRKSIGSNDTVYNYYLEEAKKKTLLQKDKPLNINLSVQQSAKLPNTINAKELMLLKTSKIYSKGLRLMVEDLLLLMQIDAVILNGDSPIPTRVIEGVVQPVAPTTAKQSLPTEWRTHTLVWRNKTDMENQRLDDLFNSLKNYESNSPHLDNDDLKQIDADDLKEMDLKWKMAMLTVRTRRFLQRTRRNLVANGPISTGFDMSKTDDFRKSQFDVISYKTILESVEARLLVYQQNESIFEEDIKLLKLEVQLRDNVLVVLRQKFKKVEQERDDLKLKLEKFQTSSKNLNQLLAIQTNDKTGLGYNTQVFSSSMFDCDELFTFETDESLPASPIYDRYHSGDRYHAVHPPYTGTFIPPKPDLVFHDAPNVNKTDHTTFNVELSPTKPDKDLSHTHKPSTPIIKDWVSNLEDDSKAEIP
nr:hypothetical protein [Tanacetum cinerariifolium]